MLDQDTKTLIPMETLEAVSPVLRNVAHPMRLRILDYLQQCGEPRNVSQIMVACEAEQAIVSQQLRILKDQGALAAKRQGSFVFYSIAESSILMLLDCIRAHRKE